jgi:hypothetical protein
MIIEYSNAGGLIREQQSTSQTNPFNSPTNTGSTGTPSGGSIQGADPNPAVFSMTLYRIGNALNLTGSITGQDNVSMQPIASSFTLTNWTPITFTFDRVGFFFSNNAIAASTALGNVTVTTGTIDVPESRYGMLSVSLLMGIILTGLKMRQLWQRRGASQA